MARAGYIISFICWLLVSLAPAYAAGPLGLPSVELSQLTTATITADKITAAEFDADQAEVANVDSCQKLSALLPAKEQCSGVAGQSAATARSRSGKDKSPLPVKAGTIRPLASIGFPAEISPLSDLRHAKRRRAHFWQVYAASMRLRN